MEYVFFWEGVANLMPVQAFTIFASTDIVFPCSRVCTLVAWTTSYGLFPPLVCVLFGGTDGV